MSYLVDTDWVIDWLAGRPDAVDLLSRLGRDGVFISLMTYGEVYEGILFSRDPDRMEVKFNEFMAVATLLPFDEETMRSYARIRGTLRAQGQLIGEGDLLIAATALTQECELVTRNLKDFARVPGLRMYQPA